MNQNLTVQLKPEETSLCAKAKCITNHTELELRIAQLKEKKLQQEEDIRAGIKAFVITLTPAALIKDTFHKLVADTEVKTDLACAGLNAGANMIVANILGKRESISGNICSFLVKNIFASLIHKNSPKLIAFVKKMALSDT